MGLQSTIALPNTAIGALFGLFGSFFRSLTEFGRASSLGLFSHRLYGGDPGET